MGKKTDTIFRNKKKITIISIILVLLLIPSVAVYNIFLAPKPLGDKLEYIGSTYSGTVPFLSDSRFSASYHYATDMTPKEVARYFTKATLKSPDNLDSYVNLSFPFSFSLHAPHTNNPIYIDYYAEGKTRANEFHLTPSNKKHLIIISGEDYKAAKDSL